MSAPTVLTQEREVEVQIELGRTQLTNDAGKSLGRGSVVSLDSPAGDPVDIYAGEKLLARGELLVRRELFYVRVLELIR
jgi:flagellar motor switch protein FliN/FliY